MQIQETLRGQRILKAALSMILYLLLSVNRPSFIRYFLRVMFLIISLFHFFGVRKIDVNSYNNSIISRLFPQVSLPHYHDNKFLLNAITRYAMYLKLQQLHPDKFLVPCYDMDIVWHTHQVTYTTLF